MPLVNISRTRSLQHNLGTISKKNGNTHREKTRRILFDCENDFTIDLFDLLMI